MGLTSVDEITKELFALCHPVISSIKNGPVAKCLLSIGKIAANTAGIGGESIDDAVNNFASLFKNNQVKVLILDDFERSRIDLQELFGYITSLIKINDIRIVLIGNDVEVKKFLQEESIHRQKLIASNISGNINDYHNNVKLLDEPLLYDSIKEKCIYKTYYYVTDRSILFDSIICSYPKSIQKLIRKYRKTIEWILNKYGCDNLRTFKVALENYVFIIDTLHKKFDNDLYIKSRVLLTCFIYTVLVKAGKDESEFNSMMYQGNERIYPIKPISEYVYKTSWNRDLLIASLKVIDEEKNTQSSNEIPASYKALNSNWYVKTDEELKQQIKEVYNELSNMPFCLYHQLVYYFYVFKEWFPGDDTFDLQTVVDDLIKNINEYPNEIEIENDHMFFERPKGVLPYFDKLDAAFKDHNMTIQNKDMKISAESLKTYSKDDLEKIEQKSYEYRSFFARLNIDEMINTVEKGTSEDIIELRRFLNSVYRISNLKDFFEADLPNLLLFREKLFLIETGSVIKNKNLDLLKKDIDIYISKLS